MYAVDRNVTGTAVVRAVHGALGQNSISERTIRKIIHAEQEQAAKQSAPRPRRWTPTRDYLSDASELDYLSELNALSRALLGRPLTDPEAETARNQRASMEGLNPLVRWAFATDYTLELVVATMSNDNSPMRWHDDMLALKPWIPERREMWNMWARAYLPAADSQFMSARFREHPEVRQWIDDQLGRLPGPPKSTQDPSWQELVTEALEFTAETGEAWLYTATDDIEKALGHMSIARRLETYTGADDGEE